MWRAPETSHAFFGQLETCRSVWVCPLCATKISERRRQEVTALLDGWAALGGRAAFISLTFPHAWGDDLESTLAAFVLALDRLRGSRAYRDLLADLGWRGSVRALEVTHGENGWHPHAHVLHLVAGYVDPGSLKARIDALWANACDLVGLPTPSVAHGVQVQDGSRAAAYATKWGLGSELTKGIQKRGRQGNASPWDLLRRARAGDPGAAPLFRAYAAAFRGRRQLVWSRGLRDWAAALAPPATENAGQRADFELLFTLDRAAWARVTHLRLEADLLRLARHFGPEEAERVLALAGPGACLAAAGGE